MSITQTNPVVASTISQLDPIATPTGSEIIAMVQNGKTLRGTASQVAGLMSAPITALQAQLNILGVHNYQVVQDADNAPALNTLIALVSAQNGGFIRVSEGNMNNGRVVPKSNVSLIGSGRRTTWKTNANRVAIFQNDQTEDLINWSVTNFLFQGGVTNAPLVPTHARTNPGGMTQAMQLLGSLDPTGSGTKTNIVFCNNWVYNCSQLPLSIAGCTEVFVNNNQFINNLDVGFRYNKTLQCCNNNVRQSADNGLSLSRGNDGVVCVGNTIQICSYDGIWLGGVGTEVGCKNFTVVGNNVQDVGYNGINAKLASSNGVISSNFVRQGYWRGPVDIPSNVNSGTGVTVGGIPDHSSVTTNFANNILVCDNVLMECARAGLFSTGGTSNCTMSNNKILNVGNQYAADGTTPIGSTDATTNCGIIFENTGANFNNRIYGNTVDDTRGTTYMNYPISPIATGVGFSRVTGNEGNRSWRNPTSYFWVTGWKQSFASGTAYALTNSNSQITFGTTSPSYTFTESGLYMIIANANVRYNGATFNAARTVTLNIHDETNSVNLSNGNKILTTDIVTTKTYTLSDATWICPFYNSQGNETINLYGDVSNAPGAGQLEISQASLTAIKIG